jgi:hypothetical protein
MIGGVASLLSAVPGLGEIADVASLATTGAKLFGGIATAVGGAASLAGTAGAVTTSTTTRVLPSPQAQFQNTVANLANGYLQDQLSGGYDAMADSITSDWGRLSVLGPMSADPNNPVFFAPTYAAESLAVNSLTQAASRSFYLALMPAIGYGVDYYPSVHGWVTQQTGEQNIPDMGVYYTARSGDEDFEHCSAYYLQPQEIPISGGFSDLGIPVPNSYVWYPTIAGVPPAFTRNEAGNPDASTTAIDMFVIAGQVSYAGTSTPFISVPSAQLTNYLFTTGGLNLPIQEFVTVDGPMQSAFTNMAANNRAKNGNGSICGSYFYPEAVPGESSPTGTPPISTDPNATTTTLTAPPTSILGDDLSVSATVMAGSTPVTTGSVYFTVDGGGSVNANLNAMGTASASIPASLVTRGAHQVVALYSSQAPYEPSKSDPTTTTVYTTAPDINLSASASSMNVSYGSTSSPITLQLTSLGGLAGAVNLSCSGLPVGMTCSFNPAQVTLTATGPASASMTINGGSASGSSFWIPGVGILLLPVSLVCLGRIRKGARQLGGILCLLALSLIGISCLSGCNGGSSPSSNAFQETGTKTVIISASSGTVSRTTPIQVTIQ